MMCTTVLHGGVCHSTSTPHKSGIKMKEKKKSLVLLQSGPILDYVEYTLNFGVCPTCGTA